jgi:hypothetical protein
MKTFRKAQIEMMGLVVIVLILAVGFLFLVAYMTGKGKQESSQEVYQKELLAYNTIGSILQATSGCRGLSIAELIDDCSSFNEINCFGFDSCAYASGEIIKILNATLNKRNQEYYFYVIDAAEKLKIAAGSGECLHNKVSATQPLTSRAGELTVGIDICG